MWSYLSVVSQALDCLAVSIMATESSASEREDYLQQLFSNQEYADIIFCYGYNDGVENPMLVWLETCHVQRRQSNANRSVCMVQMIKT